MCSKITCSVIQSKVVSVRSKSHNIESNELNKKDSDFIQYFIYCLLFSDVKFVITVVQSLFFIV